MAFDDIPEDREESYPCMQPVAHREGICGGDITKQPNGFWQCNDCGYCPEGERNKQQPMKGSVDEPE